MVSDVWSTPCDCWVIFPKKIFSFPLNTDSFFDTTRPLVVSIGLKKNFKLKAFILIGQTTAGIKQRMKNLKIIPENCTGCLRCELACSQSQSGTLRPSASVIRVAPLEAHTSYTPYVCPQCEEGWCMTACPVDAITFNGVDARAVEQGRCVGCKLCTIACPFGTMLFDVSTQKATKCNLCDGKPACVEACPTEALLFEETLSEETLPDALPRIDILGVFAQERASFDLKGRAQELADVPSHENTPTGER